MTTSKPAVEIACPACGQDSLLKRAPKYDGFIKVGEILSCAACGYVFADEAQVPFRKKKPLAGFERKNIPAPPKVFRDSEAARLCRHCMHYVVNPFLQRCARTHKEVEATDSCAQFEPKPEPEEPENSESSSQQSE